MESRLKLLGALALAASGAVHASDAASLEALEQRLSRLESQGQEYTPSASDWTDRVTINGFITYGLTRHDVHQKQGALSPGANPDEGERFYIP